MSFSAVPKRHHTRSMRLLPVLTALLAALALPSVAQQATPEPSSTAREAMWCGAAFALASKATSDAQRAADYERMSASAFERAAAELIPAGMSVEQFRVLAETIAAGVADPFRTEVRSQQECEGTLTGAAAQ